MMIKESYQVRAGDMSVAGDVSASIKRQMKRLGVPSQIMRRVSVCTYEAEINLVIHSDGGSVDFEITEDQIRVHVCDVGPGIPDIEKAMEPLYTSKPELERSGMGFSFMEAFMDELHVTSKVGEGTTVRMRKKIGRGVRTGSEAGFDRSSNHMD